MDSGVPYVCKALVASSNIVQSSPYRLLMLDERQDGKQ